MEYRIREAQRACVDDWGAATVDEKIYALAGWFADKFAPNGRKGRARTIVFNLGFPAFGGIGIYAAVLQVITAVNGG